MLDIEFTWGYLLIIFWLPFCYYEEISYQSFAPFKLICLFSSGCFQDFVFVFDFLLFNYAVLSENFIVFSHLGFIRHLG